MFGMVEEEEEEDIMSMLLLLLLLLLLVMMGMWPRRLVEGSLPGVETVKEVL